MISEATNTFLDYLRRVGALPPSDTIGGTPPIVPSRTVARPEPPAPVEQSSYSVDSLESELSKPMPQFEYKPQPQVGGIRGLLAMIASGIGHGAGANSVGEGLSRSYSGLQEDAERRRQLDYQRQAQQFKNVYGAEEDRRANLVRIAQQKRLATDSAARRAHEARMEGIAGDRASFDMAKAGQRLIEDQANRDSATARADADRASREKLAANAIAGANERARIHAASSRANARLRSGAKGAITPEDALRHIQQLEDDLARTTAAIGKHKQAKFTKGKNMGKLINPPDAQGGNPEINPLWNQKKKLEQEISGWRNWLVRGGVGQVPAVIEQQQPQQGSEGIDPLQLGIQ